MFFLFLYFFTMSKTRARVIQRPLETLKMAQEGEALTGSNSRPLPREGKETPPPPLLVRQTEKDQFLLLLLLLLQRRDPEGKLLLWEEGNGGVCVLFRYTARLSKTRGVKMWPKREKQKKKALKEYCTF